MGECFHSYSSLWSRRSIPASVWQNRQGDLWRFTKNSKSFLLLQPRLLLSLLEISGTVGSGWTGVWQDVNMPERFSGAIKLKFTSFHSLYVPLVYSSTLCSTPPQFGFKEFLNVWYRNISPALIRFLKTQHKKEPGQAHITTPVLCFSGVCVCVCTPG